MWNRWTDGAEHIFVKALVSANTLSVVTRAADAKCSQLNLTIPTSPLKIRLYIINVNSGVGCCFSVQGIFSCISYHELVQPWPTGINFSVSYVASDWLSTSTVKYLSDAHPAGGGHCRLAIPTIPTYITARAWRYACRDRKLAVCFKFGGR